MTTETPAPTDTSPEQAAQDPAVDPAPAGDPAPTELDPTDADDDNGDLDPQVKKLRREAAKYRTGNKELAARLEAMETEQKAMVSNLAKALGLAPDDAEKSPEQIIEALTGERDAFQAERDKYQQKLNDYRRADAIRAASTQHAADADALLDSRTFTDQVKELDIDADDYNAQVASLVAETVESNPRYKATPAVPTTSGTTPETSATPATAPDGPAGWHAKRFGKR